VNLLAACGIAFGAVFLLLSLLAAIMQAITRFFPVRPANVDPACAAAISSTVAIHLGGAKVTRIEETS
jgi:Na+-transporting methylmalonyl-CoA/oxaloacetate decarboxylase gamma subunit